jgi:phenylacetate-CoA ligase
MKDSLEILTDWMLDQGMDCKEAEIVLTSGAALDKNASDKLKEVFGHPGLDLYSIVEGGCLAGKCPHCNLNYINDDNCIIEILDENHESVRPGETGRAVITVLDQFSTPIIRYDIGDFITTVEYRLNCKIQFTHYLSIDGREADKLNLSNGMTLHYQHLVPVRDIQGIKQFQLIKKKNEELIFKYVSKSDMHDAMIEKLVPEKVSLLRHSKISFEKCDFIPLEPSGKFKMVKEES